MIKNNIKILIIVLCITTCKKQEDINSRQLISDFNLESTYVNYRNGIKQTSNGYSKDSTLIFSLYENNKTSHFLYIVQNKKKDTIFKFFDSTAFELKIRNFDKINRNYFVTIWEPSPQKYIGYQTGYNIEYDLYQDLYTYDSLNIYLIDSTCSKLTKLSKPTNKNISNTFKTTFNLKGEFEVIKNDSEIRMVKDTLRNKKVLYQSNVGLEIDDNNNLKSHFFNKSKIKLDENNFSTMSDRFLISESLKGDINYYYKYDANYTNTGFSRIDFIFKQNNKEHIIQTTLDRLFIKDKEYKFKNIDSLSSLQIEPFKYKNGDYFFYVTQQSFEERSDNFPIIFYIDTINWEIERVKPHSIEASIKNKKLIEIYKTEILSNNHNSILKFILKDFEIARNNDGFELIKIKQ
ncbi:hypothetical protein ESY86_15780 [Subsaximicrobium wynnwilliamsii]|uniref:Uncharacterized protein n=1 Tax=Subsaximicrobium wynnwilliamsii TaxID=291179 RepID=A0A5C6ZEW9_9FLAO|nr:hypothetical protein [Subsaximicrobium wynnwilliamsii]TXD82125.1 hypothetical protein ESY87_15370 [Subsaximicrobium wynnwilliamsii]TXD87770.1 hypothetical protein ESY86_15780 [Subsaximicrobium wynnwilliamsii]TXE01581.1 hypothetical protein ESY88_15360 [Subsaximicrobium wynnwilliamsii]